MKATRTDDVVSGLRAARKHLPPRLLHDDDEGAELFAQIATLDAYYPAHVELALLREHAARVAAQVGPEARVVNPGSGEAVAARILLAALERPSSYVPIDLVPEQLARVTLALRARFPTLEVQPLRADFRLPFDLPVPRHVPGRTLVFLPGSTIGLYEPAEARALLAQLADVAGPDRLLLLGADGTRDPALLARAYDDEHGVTAAFDKHVLEHLNRTHGATFDLDAFEHRAVWNADASRVELQLVSTARQEVRIDGETIAFASGEPVVTEHCYKHTPAAMEALLAFSGWRPRHVFASTRAAYRVWLCEPRARGLAHV